MRRPQLLGRAARVVDDVAPEGRDVLHDVGLLAPVRELGGRRAGKFALRPGVREHHQPVGLGKRHGFEQHRVDDREDGCVGADAQGQDGNRGKGEARRAPEQPERVGQVCQERFHAASR